MAQVLGQGLDRLTTVEQHRGIEVPQRVKSLGPLRFRHTGTPQRGLPEEVVEVVPVSAVASRVHNRSRAVTNSPSGCCHGNVTTNGGNCSMCADRAGDAVGKRDLPRVLPCFGGPNTKRLRTILICRMILTTRSEKSPDRHTTPGALNYLLGVRVVSVITGSSSRCTARSYLSGRSSFRTDGRPAMSPAPADPGGPDAARPPQPTSCVTP